MASCANGVGCTRGTYRERRGRGRFPAKSPAIRGRTHSDTRCGGIMDYVKLGASNLKVSRLSLGGLTFGDPKWRPYAVGEAESREIIRRALDHGINLFDTS